MIDLTPLDVRKKKGDFRKSLRGYEPEVVDAFLDLVADRLEEVARENASLRDRNSQLGEAIAGYRAREHAMNEALVTAQQLRQEVREQAQREADLVVREARGEAERILAEARRQLAGAAESTRRVHGQRLRFLRGFRAYVERQLAEIEAEEERLQETMRGEVREVREPPPAEPAPAPPAPPAEPGER